MKLLGANEESADSSQRPQIRTSQDDAAVGYGFHQENEFPAFVQKRWPGTDDAVDVNIISLYYIHFSIFIYKRKEHEKNAKKSIFKQRKNRNLHTDLKLNPYPEPFTTKERRSRCVSPSFFFLFPQSSLASSSSFFFASIFSRFRVCTKKSLSLFVSFLFFI